MTKKMRVIDVGKSSNFPICHFFIGLELLSKDCVISDMRFVHNFTPPDFQAKNFTLSISSNFNSFSDKNTKK